MNSNFINRFSILLFYYICIVFCVKKCWNNYIYESQLNDLRESVKHFLEYRKNVTTIPLDCTDRPFIEIDIVFEEETINGSKYYAVYGNNSYYVEIQGITRDHLPIIHRDIQPMPVNSRFQRKMHGKNPIPDYKFVGPLYLRKIPNEKENKYSLIGFNQVWVGCPQPLCISPGFDGILSLDSMANPSVPHHRSHGNILILFRGNYFWFYEFGTKSPIHPPLTDSAIRIEDRFVDRRAVSYNYHRPRRGRYSAVPQKDTYLNDSMVVPTYIDAIVPGVNKYNNCLYFFKNDEFVCYEWYSQVLTPMKIASEWKSSDPNWKSAKIDAAFYSKTLIYFIAGEQLWCFANDRTSCHEYPKNLKDLHKGFPENITSAFQHKEYIYIIKGSVYYKISVSRFPLKLSDDDMKEKYLFEDLLGCDESLYTAWGFHSYDYFIKNFAEKMKTEIYLNTDHKESHFNPTFLIISILVVTMSSSLLLMVWYFKPDWMRKVLRTIKAPFS